MIHLTPGEPGVLEAEMNPKVTKEGEGEDQGLLRARQAAPRTVLALAEEDREAGLRSVLCLRQEAVIDKIAERLPVTIVIELLSTVLLLRRASL